MSEQQNPQRRVTIRARAFGPGKGEAKRPPVSPASRKKMMDIFRTELAKNSPSPKMYLEGKTFPRTFAHLRRVGRGAAVVQWLRHADARRLGIKAISIIMGNLDPKADAKALAAVRRIKDRLRYPYRVYGEIEQEPRPLVATLFLDRKCFEESVFVAAAECLAIAFFQPDMKEMANKPQPPA